MSTALQDSDILRFGGRVSEFGKSLTPYSLVIPVLVFVLGVLGYAVGGGLVLSLHETGIFLSKTFVGFKNHVAIFNDPRFQGSLWTTVEFAISSIVLGITMSTVVKRTLYDVGFSRSFSVGSA
ncbi:MAG: hypothetical protein OXI01_13615 [Albidovulum sp.]|nr:hypothetical protein [Albidovulum sp.]